MERRKKPKVLVVDDEPDNLDLLYRTFRRDFRVFKADSGIQALEVLAQQGEVAVIISDQRMPEMKGTEFLSKTVSQFPDTIRIVLTGFTDVEDLVDAINSGQVYKYITKPWDPNKLKDIVLDAVETYDVIRDRRLTLQRSQSQTKLLSQIMQVSQDFETVEDCLEPITQAFSKTLTTDTCILNLVQDDQLSPVQGCYPPLESPIVSLGKDPLILEAIASKQTQTWVNSASTPPPEGIAYYQQYNLQLHLVVPIIYRKKVLGILSLQWQHPYQIQNEDLQMIQLASQQVGLTLATIC